MIEMSYLTVINKNGECSTFDSRKILSEILEAEKELTSVVESERRDWLEKIVILIENEIYNCFEKTVQIEEVWKIIEDRLIEFEEVKLVQQIKRMG